MESVTVVVPFTPGDLHRDRAWEWVRAKYEQHHPGWDIVIGTGDPHRWVKADAVMPAIRAATGIVIVADADCWCDGLVLAVEQVEAGAPWAIPHRRVKRLARTSTERVYAGELPDRLELEEPAYEGAPGGGLVVLPRDTAVDIPLDPRFVGYGNEDRAWGKALWILAGRPWRGDMNLFHLWHLPQERPDRNHGTPESEALRKRYNAAENHEAPMRALLDEIR